MKRAIFFLILFTSLASAQYIEHVDTVYTLPGSAVPMQKCIYQGYLYVYANGAWRQQLVGTGHIYQRDSSYSIAPGAPDTSVTGKFVSKEQVLSPVQQAEQAH
jgi:hypothetical protein